eukprot:CAMPEP_0201572930 /NCGR_PEP_ID=MMETSP0190_2-20130828/16501_1 /ASSEMBLY_ACC=CAM_ASM_000263 /TAXON_ID=37353 /ORGANISM="Rosalina sp." /LENGTH=47 /DNA_ID= /DNA_START= /DNA_END= /DNA_ORIENTATION=
MGNSDSAEKKNKQQQTATPHAPAKGHDISNHVTVYAATYDKNNNNQN